MTQPGLLPGRSGSAWIAIITIVDQEFQAVRNLFNLKVQIPGTKFFVQKEQEARTYEIVLVRSSDRGNGPAAEVVRETMEHFFPKYILVIGIAGGAEGRDEVALGDVIIVDFVDHYESMKISDGKLIERRTPYDHPSLYIRDCAEPQRYTDWSKRIPIAVEPPEPCSPKAIVGHIASGEKLFDDPGHSYQSEVLKIFDKALGVDMESYGIARAVFHGRQSVHYNPLYLVLRGISDLVVSKAPVAPAAGAAVASVIPAGGAAAVAPVAVAPAENNTDRRAKWRHYAANAAAAFGFAVTRELLSRIPGQTPGEAVQIDK